MTFSFLLCTASSWHEVGRQHLNTDPLHCSTNTLPHGGTIQFNKLNTPSLTTAPTIKRLYCGISSCINTTCITGLFYSICVQQHSKLIDLHVFLTLNPLNEGVE